MKKHECKHYYDRVEQRNSFYWLICQECGYKMQLIGIQKFEQAEEQRILNNKKVKK